MKMLYPYMTLYFNDENGIDIVCSDIFHKSNSNKDYIKVYFERVSKDGQSFDSMNCILPSLDDGMHDVKGFSEEEAKNHYKKIRHLATDMIEYVKEESHYT